MVYISNLMEFPPCFYLSLSDKSILIDTALHLTIDDQVEHYALRGVIYLEGEHFTSRIVKANGDVWFHDGIEMANATVFEGPVHGKEPHFLNTCIRGETIQSVAGVIYARINT
jgi:hypothetical protein